MIRQTVENLSRPLGRGRPRGFPAASAGSARYNVAVTDIVRNSNIDIRDFSIRDFVPKDFETLWCMDQQCFPPGIAYSKRELKAYIHEKGAFTLVAESRAAQSRAAEDKAKNADKAAGFIVAYHGPTGHVITIDVIAAARRAGVGSLLLQAAEDRLRAGGSRAVGLETAVDNLAALSFYKRHGYSVIRTWPRYYSNGLDALVMRKELT